MNLKQKGTIKIILVIVLCFFTWSFIGSSDIAYAELYMSISGTIKDADMGAGIGGVAVFAVKEDDPEKSYSEATDSQGNFVLKNVPSGTYDLYVDSPSNYVSSNKPYKIIVYKGRNVVGINVQLDKAGSISGKVYQKDGITPIKKASVVAYTSEDNMTFGETNDRGEYIVSGLKETNSCTVVIYPDGYGGVYKNSLSVRRKELTTGVNFILDSDLSTGMTGEINGSNGLNIAGAVVVLYGEGGGGTAPTDSSGKFSILGLASGIYTAAIIDQGYQILGRFSNIHIDNHNVVTVSFSVNSQNSNLTASQQITGFSITNISNPSGYAIDNVLRTSSTRKSQIRLIIHGKYCGPGAEDPTLTSPGVDCIDEACRQHDICYRDNNIRIYPPFPPSSKRKKCDQDLCWRVYSCQGQECLRILIMTVFYCPHIM